MSESDNGDMADNGRIDNGGQVVTWWALDK